MIVNILFIALLSSCLVAMEEGCSFSEKAYQSKHLTFYECDHALSYEKDMNHFLSQNVLQMGKKVKDEFGSFVIKARPIVHLEGEDIACADKKTNSVILESYKESRASLTVGNKPVDVVATINSTTGHVSMRLTYPEEKKAPKIVEFAVQDDQSRKAHCVVINPFNNYMYVGMSSDIGIYDIEKYDKETHHVYSHFLHYHKLPITSIALLGIAQDVLLSKSQKGIFLQHLGDTEPRAVIIPPIKYGKIYLKPSNFPSQVVFSHAGTKSIISTARDNDLVFSVPHVWLAGRGISMYNMMLVYAMKYLKDAKDSDEQSKKLALDCVRKLKINPYIRNFEPEVTHVFRNFLVEQEARFSTVLSNNNNTNNNNK